MHGRVDDPVEPVVGVIIERVPVGLAIDHLCQCVQIETVGAKCSINGTLRSDNLDRLSGLVVGAAIAPRTVSARLGEWTWW